MKNLLDPVAAAAEPVTQTVAYTWLRAEAAKIDSPSNDAVAWHRMATTALALSAQGKDLTVAAFATGAHAQSAGISGLAEAMSSLAHFVDAFWDTMTPPLARMRGRVNALGWFVRRAEILLACQTTLQADVHAALTEAFAALNRIVLARFATDAPTMRSISEQLDRLVPIAVALPAAPVSDAPSPQPPPAVPTAKTSAADVAKPASPVAADGGAPQALSASVLGPSDLPRWGDALASIAVALRDDHLHDERAYRLLRAGLWLHIAKAPPLRDGVTNIAALPAPLRLRLDAATQEERWKDLLRESETALVKHRLCLDLNYHTAQALLRLGGAYDKAAQQVHADTCALVARLAPLATLCAFDGTPLANAATRAWLQSAGAAMPPPLPDPMPPKCASADGRVPRSPRSHFAGRLARAEASLASGHVTLAHALYTGLDRRVRLHRLERWEPTLAARCLGGYLACLQRLKSPHDRAVETVFRRLAQIDPDRAMHLTREEK